MMFKKLGMDLVHVADSGFARLRTKAGAFITGRDFQSELDKPIVEVKGWVNLLMRERGKVVPGSRRDGHNIWTNTGREYLAMLMSYQSGTTPFRSDRVRYIGVGTGSQLEEPGVLTLASPIESQLGTFLVDLEVPPTFPLTPSRTTVRYRRVFAENEITLSAGSQVNVSELGLFTSGSVITNYVSRDTTSGAALQQNPVAYKTFEPVGKTDALELEVSWEIRF